MERFDFHILIIDKDQASLEMLADAISSTTQNEIRTATTGEEGLKMAREWKPEIILVDNDLDDVPGVKILEEVNTIPDLSASVILMSKEVDREMRIIAFSYSAHDFLHKPIEILELLQKLQNLLSIKKATQKFRMLNNKLQKEKSIMVKYFSEDIVDKILSEEIKPNLGGDILNATVLFFDLRNSTSIAEQITAKQFSELLSMLFTDLMDLVYGYEGSVNKLMGDGMLITFGAPVSSGNDTLQAVRCGLAIRKYLESFNSIRPSYLKEPISGGVGIATGKVFAGNIGSTRRMEYTVLGDAVNIAARLESLTKLAGVDNLIDGNTYAAVWQITRCKKVKFAKIRGKIQEVKIYHVAELFEEQLEDFAEDQAANGQLVID